MIAGHAGGRNQDVVPVVVGRHADSGTARIASRTLSVGLKPIQGAEAGSAQLVGELAGSQPRCRCGPGSASLDRLAREQEDEPGGQPEPLAVRDDPQSHATGTTRPRSRSSLLEPSSTPSMWSLAVLAPALPEARWGPAFPG